MKNIVLPNLFCFGRFDFRAGGLSLQHSSDSLHLSFQNGYLNWVTRFFVIVRVHVRFVVCVCSHMCSPIIYPSRGKTSYLFLCPAKRPVVNLHSKLYISYSRLHEPWRMRSPDSANTVGLKYHLNQVIIKSQLLAVADDQWIITHAIDYEG